MTQTTALAERGKQIKGLLSSENAMRAIRDVLPKHMDAAKLVRVTNVAISRTPKLMECDPMSILTSVVVAARLGLEPDGVLGSAYLVPFWNSKTNQRECQLIPGYRGLIDLARRSGSVLSMNAQVVRGSDVFEYEYGLNPVLRHKPDLNSTDEQMVAVYAIAHIRDGAPEFEVMSRHQVDKIKAGSKAKGGPWIDHYDEMARKTVIRRLCKRLPLSVELAAAAQLQGMSERGSGDIGIFGVSETLGVENMGVEVVDSTVADRNETLADEIQNLVDAGGQPDVPASQSAPASTPPDGNGTGKPNGVTRGGPKGETPWLTKLINLRSRDKDTKATVAAIEATGMPEEVFRQILADHNGMTMGGIPAGQRCRIRRDVEGWIAERDNAPADSETEPAGA